MSIGSGQSHPGDLYLRCTPRGGGGEDKFLCSSSPAAAEWAKDLADRTLADGDALYQEFFGGTFVFASEGWVVLWKGPKTRADTARSLLEAFAEPGRADSRRTLRDLAAELRPTVDYLVPNYPVEIQRAELFFAYYHRVLCAPVILVLRVAAVLVPDGSVWARVGQGLAFALLLGLALVIGRGFRPASRQPPAQRPSAGQ